MPAPAPNPRANEGRPPIEVRRPTFDFARERDRFWFGGNSLITVFMAALSATFPPGEREFVRSVMHYKEQLPADLLRDVRKFAGQESQHAHQHTSAWLDSLGFDASGCADDLEREIESFLENTPDDILLAATVGAEHVTAVLANYLLTHSDVSARLPGDVRELILWHAVEEIEHKAVAFDVYDHVSGDRDKLRRVFAFQVVMFFTTTGRYMRHMLRSLDHRPSARDWVGFANFMLGKRGMLTTVAPHLATFFRRDFHPWDRDDRHLIEAWRAGRDARRAAAAAAAA